jgi:hypothetical protein
LQKTIFFVVVVMLVGLALPATAQVGASVGLDIFGSRSNNDLEGRSLIGWEVSLDGRPLCYLHTDNLSQFALGFDPQRIELEPVFGLVGLDGMAAEEAMVSAYTPSMGDEAVALTRVGEKFLAGVMPKGKKLRQPVNWWEGEPVGRYLDGGPTPFFLTVVGRFDHKSGLTGGSRRGVTAAMCVLDVIRADMSGMSRRGVYSQYFGYWTPFDASLLTGPDVSTSAPSTSPAPSEPQQINEQQLTTLLADVDLSGLESQLADIALATREGNEVNGQVLRQLAENQELIMELLERPATVTVEQVEAPSEPTPTPPTTTPKDVEQILILSVAGRQLEDGETISYSPGMRIIARMSGENGVITSNLELPGKVSDSRTFPFAEGQEPIWFKGLCQGTWRLTVNYQDGARSDTDAVILEVSK